MAKAVRAIIIEGDKILVMHRNKQGSEYFTLVGGRIDGHETPEQALKREIKEETGLEMTGCRPVFSEDHAEPYNSQIIYLCEVAPHQNVSIQDSSEEGFLNRIGINVHTPVWAELKAFASLPFRTPQLQQAILDGLKNGFPNEPIKL